MGARLAGAGPRVRRFAVLSLLLMGAAASPCAEPVTSATPAADMVRVLLNDAAGAAVSALGRTDGFMGRPRRSIALKVSPPRPPGVSPMSCRRTVTAVLRHDIINVSSRL